MSIFYTKIRLYAGREQVHNYIVNEKHVKVRSRRKDKNEKKIFRRFRT